MHEHVEIRRDSPAPPGYTAVTPWIIAGDTRALLRFMEAAFDAEVGDVVENPDGSVGHAEARIGDAVVMAFDASKDTPAHMAFLRLYVDDAGSAHGKALRAGATSVTKPTLLAFGDRVGRVRDPQGNIWWLQERVEDVGDEEMARRWSDPEWARAMDYVQSSLAEALPSHE